MENTPIIVLLSVLFLLWLWVVFTASKEREKESENLKHANTPAFVSDQKKIESLNAALVDVTKRLEAVMAERDLLKSEVNELKEDAARFSAALVLLVDNKEGKPREDVIKEIRDYYERYKPKGTFSKTKQ